MAKVEISKLNVELTIDELQNIRCLINKFQNGDNDRVEGSVFAVQIDKLGEDLEYLKKILKIGGDK